MKVRELKEYLEHMSLKYDDFDDWDIYSEDERIEIYDDEAFEDLKFTEDKKIIQECQEENDKSKSLLETETNAGWHFVEGHDCESYKVYYKEIAGGAGVIPDQKAVCMCINY